MSVQWFVNIDPAKPGDPHWMAYGDEDAEKIEKAYQKKSKTLMLNKTYKIDFTSMRQIRREDADRWRSIKRGGRADAKPPKADGEASDAEDAVADADADDSSSAPIKAAPDAIWPPPATAPAAKKKGKKESDEEKEDVASEADTLPPAGKPKKLEPSSSVVSVVSTSAATEKQVVSLKAQLADIEQEVESYSKENTSLKKQLTDAKKQAETSGASKVELEKLQKQNTILTKEVAGLTKDLAAAKTAEEALATRLKEASKAQTQVTALQAKVTQLEASLKATQGLQAELEESRSLYATLIAAIKPIAQVMGVAATSPIGQAIAAYDKLEKSGKISPTSIKASPKPVAAAAPPSKKRGRDDEDESKMSDNEEPASKPVEKKAKPAPPPASPVRAASPAPMEDVDDDATQPMVAPEHDGGDGGAGGGSEDTDMYDGPSNFLESPNQLEGVSVKLPHSGIPMSFAPVAAPNVPTNAHLIVVGGRNGTIDLLEVDSTTGASKSIPLKITGRPAHRFARPSAKTDDGEDYSQTSHIHSLAIVSVNHSDTKFRVYSGEGRLLRIYELTLAAAQPSTTKNPHTLTFKDEIDVGMASWITVVKQVTSPDKKLYLGVGISGAGHSVQMYSIQDEKAKLQFTYPVRSDEVRGIGQLSADSRVVICGCSCQLDGALDEGGAIELWKWNEVNPAKGRSFLKNDLHVNAAIGLRCNGIQTWVNKAGQDQLLAAYEYCSNGQRQLIQYTFQSNGSDVAINIEPKNQPNASENTYTSIAVSPDHTKCGAMTYGGKLLIYDLLTAKKLATIDAHAETENDDGTHVLMTGGKDGSGVLITMGGQKEITIWKSK